MDVAFAKLLSTRNFLDCIYEHPIRRPAVVESLPHDLRWSAPACDVDSTDFICLTISLEPCHDKIISISKTMLQSVKRYFLRLNEISKVRDILIALNEASFDLRLCQLVPTREISAYVHLAARLGCIRALRAWFGTIKSHLQVWNHLLLVSWSYFILHQLFIGFLVNPNKQFRDQGGVGKLLQPAHDGVNAEDDSFRAR